VLRFVPPLIISEEEIKRAVGVVGEILQEMA
jgi:4-aminobutyrate aminotransferase-like enzyme